MSVLNEIKPYGQKVFIFAPREEPPDLLKTLERKGCEVIMGDPAWQLPGGSHEDELVQHAREAVALAGTSIRNTPISRRILEASQRLRVVAKYSVGVDDVDVEAASELGIMVCHAPTESNCFGVAESTVMMILAMLKKAMSRDADIRAGQWREPHHAIPFVGARADGYKGLTIGLVGLGRIGTRVAQLFAPWRVRIIAYAGECAVCLLRTIAARIRCRLLPCRADEGDALHVARCADAAHETHCLCREYSARQGAG
ncbi:MAG: hypothetical protein FJX29_12180 [Alphaproteobacteria bacterium]|nr:hypothetical protein [Alphaproteobacteria bacterium]